MIDRLEVARALDDERLCAEGLAPLEPNVPWEGRLLAYRLRCYERAGHSLEPLARRDLARFLADSPPILAEGLRAGGLPPASAP